MVLVCIGYRVWITVISTALSTDHMECGSSMLTVLRVSFCLFSISILPTRTDDQHCPDCRLETFDCLLSVLSILMILYPLVLCPTHYPSDCLSLSTVLPTVFPTVYPTDCLLLYLAPALLSVVSTVYSAFDRPPPELNHLANRKSSR